MPEAPKDLSTPTEPQAGTAKPVVPLKQIRTYQGDVAEALKSQQETILSIQRQEQARTARATPVVDNTEEKSARKSGIFLFGGIILLLLVGGVVGWFAYAEYETKTALPTIETVPNAFISSQKRTDIDALTLSRESLITALENERISIPTGSITHIQLKTGSEESSPLLSTETFLTLIKSQAPGNLTRSFNPLFMLGVLGNASGHPFMIIKLDSFDNAFPGMLAWESDLADDLLPLFASQEITDQIPSQPNFRDVTIQNKNIRSLIDSQGKTILLYTFYDNNLLLITDNEDSLKALLGRLSSEKLSR